MNWIIEITHSAKKIVLHQDQAKTEQFQSLLERIHTTTELYTKVIDNEGTLHWISKDFLTNSCISFKENKQNNLRQISSVM